MVRQELGAAVAMPVHVPVQNDVIYFSEDSKVRSPTRLFSS